jgi:hypothetical protein
MLEALGSGESVVEATNDALSEGLRMALGALVRREVILENETLTENILSYTDGFIDRFEVVELNRVAGAYEVRVAMLILPQPVRDAFPSDSNSETQVSGELLAAQSTLLRNRRAAGSALFQVAAEELKKLVEVHLGEVELINELPGKDAIITIPYNAELTQNSFDSWRERYEPWFENMGSRIALGDNDWHPSNAIAIMTSSCRYESQLYKLLEKGEGHLYKFDFPIDQSPFGPYMLILNLKDSSGHILKQHVVSPVVGGLGGVREAQRGRKLAWLGPGDISDTTNKFRISIRIAEDVLRNVKSVTGVLSLTYKDNMGREKPLCCESNSPSGFKVLPHLHE